LIITILFLLTACYSTNSNEGFSTDSHTAVDSKADSDTENGKSTEADNGNIYVDSAMALEGWEDYLLDNDGETAFVGWKPLEIGSDVIAPE
jgi:hypothetical protein